MSVPTHPTPTHTTTRDDIQKERIDRMNDMAKKMSNDMSRYTPQKPKSVRFSDEQFSDDVDKLSPEILESRLEAAIASRNLDVVDISDTTVSDVQPLKPETSLETTYQEIKRMHREVKSMYDEMKQMVTDLRKT